ncbi:hypothetical protein BVY01_02565 [bacterium I07]|nr:hypothetical protein BVY01_02565 [bacterium I07]
MKKKYYKSVISFFISSFMACGITVPDPVPLEIHPEEGLWGGSYDGTLTYNQVTFNILGDRVTRFYVLGRDSSSFGSDITASYLGYEIPGVGRVEKNRMKGSFFRKTWHSFEGEFLSDTKAEGSFTGVGHNGTWEATHGFDPD